MALTKKDISYLELFKTNLDNGIKYYQNLIPKIIEETKKHQTTMLNDINTLQSELENSFNYYIKEVKRKPATV